VLQELQSRGWAENNFAKGLRMYASEQKWTYVHA
jgi:hypothetical protein